jgi:hypothetical protein
MSRQQNKPIEVKTVGDQILGVTWCDEYYPVVVKSSRLTKDCTARVYTVKSDEQLLLIRRDEDTGAWTFVGLAS